MKRIRVTNGEIMRHVQLPQSSGAYFVLPSQLNGAEYPTDTVIVRKVEDYVHDNTGGPCGQLAAHPAAAQFILDNAASSDNPDGINSVDHILAASPEFELKNGYLVMPKCNEELPAKALFEGFTRTLHKLRPLIMHEVAACGLTPDRGVLSQATHRVGLVYASAVPVDAYVNKARGEVERKLHRRCAEAVLVAQYYGALRAVAERPGVAKPAKVFLTPLGDGTFNNSWESIASAIAMAVELLAREPKLLDLLEVEVLVWSGKPAEDHPLRLLLGEHNKLLADGGS